MCSGAVPELVSVTLCGPGEVPCVTVPKVTVLGLRVTAGLPGGGAWPVPVSGTDCGELGASSTMLMVQVPFGERTVGTVQLGVAAKSAAFAPVSAMEFTLSP